MVEAFYYICNIDKYTTMLYNCKDGTFYFTNFLQNFGYNNAVIYMLRGELLFEKVVNPFKRIRKRVYYSTFIQVVRGTF